MKLLHFLGDPAEIVSKWPLEDQLDWALNVRVSPTKIGLYYDNEIYKSPHLIIPRDSVTQDQWDKLCWEITKWGGLILETKD